MNRGYSTTIKETELIKQLYFDNYSAPQISTRLGLSLNRVYRILKKENIQRRNARASNKLRFEMSPLSYRFKENINSSEKELLIAAVMLYFGEGAKSGTTVDFANSDPATLKIFINFLRKICQIDEKRLRLYLYCFSDQNPSELISFWSRTLNVRIRNFTKPYIRKISKNLKRTMIKGVLHIRYSDKRLLEKILSLKDSLVEKFT